MKTWIFSDFHLQFDKIALPDPAPDARAMLDLLVHGTHFACMVTCVTSRRRQRRDPQLPQQVREIGDGIRVANVD